MSLMIASPSNAVAWRIGLCSARLGRAIGSAMHSKGLPVVSICSNVPTPLVLYSECDDHHYSFQP